MSKSKEKKIVVANWKMNPSGIEEANEIFSAIKKSAKRAKNATVVVCPPFTYLHSAEKLYAKSNIALGAQDVFWQNSGPYTGEISPGMLKDSGAKYVIVGHSERRTLFDTDEIVCKKVGAAIRSGLVTVLCVGESARDGDGKYFQFLKEQILSSLKGLQKRHLEKLIIAYEPIWAIGKDAKNSILPRDLHEIVILIRKILSDHYKAAVASRVKILYGGSVAATNAAELLLQGNVDGFIVGRESLSKEGFDKMLGACL